MIKLRLNSEIQPSQEILGLIALTVVAFIGASFAGDLAVKIRKMKEAKRSPYDKIKEIIDSLSPSKMNCSVAQLCEWKADKINGGEPANSGEKSRSITEVVKFSDFLSSMDAVAACASVLISCSGSKGSKSKLESIFNSQAKNLKAGNEDSDNYWNPTLTTITYPSDVVFKSPGECGKKLGSLAQKAYDTLKKLPDIVKNCLNQPTDNIDKEVLEDRMVFIEFSVKLVHVFNEIINDWVYFCTQEVNE